MGTNFTQQLPPATTTQLSGTSLTEPLPPTETTSGPSMNWVMVLWAIAFMAVVIFGVATYLLSWWFQRG